MRPNTKKFLSLGLALTALATPLSAQVFTKLQQQNQLNVLTYNVHNGIGLDGKTDYARIGTLIRNSGADVVAIQEVDSATQRSKGRYVLGEIAAEALMRPTFGAAIPYDGGKYGIGILSKEKPLSVRHIALPGREEKRTLLIAEFNRYVMACAHLSLTEADRMASIDLIRKEAERVRKPFILAGDWNATPQSKLLEQLKNDFRIVNNTKNATFPADKPDSCIDYIALYKATGEQLVPRRSYVLNEKNASDHRPVLARMQFKTPASQLVYHAPYLQNPTPESITVMFQTNAVSHCWVEYGTDTLNLKRARDFIGGQEVCYDIENKITLDSLKPGQTYYYRVCAQEIIDYQSYSKTFGETYKSPFYAFTLPTAQTSDFTALILNDLHETTATINAFSKLAQQIPHDFVIFNGDCLPEPFDRDYAIKNIHILTDAFNSSSKPTFFIRGNHEIRNAYSAGMPSLFAQPGGEATYGAFSWGDTRFVMLDCGEDKPDDHWVYYGLNDFTQLRMDQVGFLKKELASKAFKKASRRVLIHHIPLWGNGDGYSPCYDLWSPVLKKAPFDIDLAAHTHRYKYHPIGEKGNPFPVIVGGGPNPQRATLLVLTKKGKELTLRVLDNEGAEKLKLDL